MTDLPELAEQYEVAAAEWLREHPMNEVVAVNTPCMPPTPAVDPFPLSTPVLLAHRKLCIVTAYSIASSQRRRVSWFDRHFWVVRHKWTDIENLTLVGAAENAVERAALSA